MSDILQAWSSGNFINTQEFINNFDALLKTVENLRIRGHIIDMSWTENFKLMYKTFSSCYKCSAFDQNHKNKFMCKNFHVLCSRCTVIKLSESSYESSKYLVNCEICKEITNIKFSELLICSSCSKGKQINRFCYIKSYNNLVCKKCLASWYKNRTTNLNEPLTQEILWEIEDNLGFKCLVCLKHEKKYDGISKCGYNCMVCRKCQSSNQIGECAFCNNNLIKVESD